MLGTRLIRSQTSQSNMRLIEYREFAKKYFDPKSRPSDITLRRWLRDGQLPGRKIGSVWYVDEHVFLANGDELVLRVLRGE